MRNKLSVLASAMGILLACHTQADAVMFDFDTLVPNNAALGQSGNVGTYMSSVYGSNVTVASDVGVGTGSFFGSVDFGPDPYVFSNVIDIRFDNPIESLSFDGVVFGGLLGGSLDFHLIAMNGGTAANVVTINNVMGAFSSGPIDFLALGLGSVDRLIFSDNFVHDIGIDNMEVTPSGAGSPSSIPLPASAALGALGLCAVGVVTSLNKKRTHAA